MTRQQFLVSIPFAASVLSGAEATREAPELSLADTAGKPFRLSALRGKIVALEFMLTTCPHCQNTAKLMSRLQREYGPKGFQAISLPFNDDAVAAAPRFVSEHGVTHLVAAIPRERVYEFAQLSTVMRHSVPIMVFVDRRGRIRDQFEGDAPFFQNEEANFRAKIVELLKDPPLRQDGSRPSTQRPPARSISALRLGAFTEGR
ncbi:MAG: TlpA family protein disulfide reductase [Bryobacteraceae bacterium]|jgi:peroxiredoxin|nr:TlpA family protein disulfide reductase [Solibacteraceae bacterium]MCO5350023.1 TlpA family protein disulfide reductase [Bryobacteraceae bacterium]MCZ2074080.1 TlpA family protein disulfide reductase [Bryobacterales bacterium]